MQKRNYQKERKYDSKPSVMKKRANRNAARYKMMKAGKVKKYDGKDVHHVGGNALKRNSKLHHDQKFSVRSVLKSHFRAH